MKVNFKKILNLSLLLLLAGCAPISKRQPVYPNKNINNSNMELYSNDFEDGSLLDPRFTCDGEDIRPHLGWSEVPSEAKSLALAMFDPDAPGGGFLHWLVVDLPPQDRELNSDDPIPAPGKELLNDFGKVGYGGPCPPSGTHRYIFTLYALSVESIEPSDYQDFLSQVEKYKIAEVSLTGLYSRQ